MPIYEYECSSCGLAQDHLQRISAPPPHCGDPDTIMEKIGDGEPCGADALKLQPPTSTSFRLQRGVGWDGWERTGPGTIGRVVDSSKHISDQT